MLTHIFIVLLYKVRNVSASVSLCEPKTKKKQLEMRGMQLALQPLLAAERDRAFIKHWKNVVEGEKDLMKDVPGWVPGTWWGEPVFKTVPHEK